MTVALPARSHVDGSAGAGRLPRDGPLGERRFKTGIGAIRLERGRPSLKARRIGEVTVERVTGDADVNDRRPATCACASSTAAP